MSPDSPQEFSKEKDLSFSREAPESRERISCIALRSQIARLARSGCLVNASFMNTREALVLGDVGPGGAHGGCWSPACHLLSFSFLSLFGDPLFL